MIKDLTVDAVAREGVGKGPTRRLRAQGMIPVAVYGEGLAPAAVAVDAKAIANILRSDSGHNTIFRLSLPGEKAGDEPATVIIKDWQVDPVKGRLLHADVMRLSLTEITRVSVRIETKGEPVGVKSAGGILELELREVEVECLPGDIPESLMVDVRHLHIGDHVTVADLVYDREKVRLLSDEHKIVAGVLAPRLVEEPTPAAAAPEAAPEGAAEPEVIKKGKAEEE
ncbi:MAG TPA: 50S ribosomal protein L25 [Blastocatellia bacterium]|nr:50S ribosomal protein L25 [Blastocatellia bacterium]